MNDNLLTLQELYEQFVNTRCILLIQNLSGFESGIMFEKNTLHNMTYEHSHTVWRGRSPQDDGKL